MKSLWPLYLSELIGTALLVAVGLSVVIADFGSGSFIVHYLPDAGPRRLLTGFLFGCTGALIAISPLGKISGAHINPVVSLSFWLEGKMGGAHAAGYAVAQLLGGIVGAVPLLAWGAMGASVRFGATVPGDTFSPLDALGGEAVTTFMLVFLLFLLLGHARLRRFTPLLFPFLYAVMVFLEAPVSGTSTNPARSVGPAVVSGDWYGWWIYFAGPVAGACLAVAVRRHPWLQPFEVEVSKLYHFNYDPLGLFKHRKYTHPSLMP